MSFDENSEELDISDERSKQCILTATIKRFSKFKKRCSLQLFTKYKTSDHKFKEYFTPAFFANGDCKENEGHVSILVLINKFFCYFLPENILQIEFNCTVSVVDTAGYKRFRRTFVYIFDSKLHYGLQYDFPKLGFDRYLKRETLCNESSELLPGDCLNVHVEINYDFRFTVERFSIPETPRYIETEITNPGEAYIGLDSPFGQKLFEVSEYFQRASVTPMVEQKTRRVCVPVDESEAFLNIANILMKGKGIKIFSVVHVFEMYTVADKYGIETVIEACRQLLKSFLCGISDSKFLEHAVESIKEISELAERYKDESLKEMVALFSESKKKFKTDESAFEKHIKYKLGTDWTCEYVESINLFCFHLPEKGGNDREPELEFYK